MRNDFHIIDPYEPREILVPATQETFEAQVLVITKPRKKTVYPYGMDVALYCSFSETYRVLESKKFHAELVGSQLQGGKPTLIIYEDEP